MVVRGKVRKNSLIFFKNFCKISFSEKPSSIPPTPENNPPTL